MKTSNSNHVLLATTAFILVSRLVMLGSGYGRDPDAWRFAVAAQKIATSGQYTASRMPGFPLPEFVYAALSRFPGTWLPLIALLSAISAGLFALIVKRLGGRYAWLAGITLAFVPVVYIHSTTLMDYAWSLVFLLGAVYALLRSRAAAAGILIGLAAACRITTLVMIVPASFLLVGAGTSVRTALRKLSVLWLPGIALAILSLLPALLTYGDSMLEIADTGRRSTDVLRTATVGVWGTTGLLGLVLSVASIAAYSLVKRKRETAIPTTVPENHVICWLCAIGVFGIFFLRLPHESGYLIPVVPFVILVIARFTHRFVFIAFCALVIVSPFAALSTSGLRPGPLIEDRSARIAYTLETRKALSILHGLPDTKSVVVAGWLSPQLQVIDGRSESGILVRESLELDELERLISEGYSVYVLPIRELHDPTVMKLLDHGAKMLPYWE